MFGELSSDCLDKLHKVLRVAVGHIQTYVLEGGDGLQDGAQLLQICFAAAWAGSYMLWRKAKMLPLMNKNVCNYDCYVTIVCVSNNLLKIRDWWCYLQAVWMISSKVFPVFYRVVFMNGCEEGVLNRKKWRQQDIGDIEVSKFNKHKNTFQFVYSFVIFLPNTNYDFLSQ